MTSIDKPLELVNLNFLTTSPFGALPKSDIDSLFTELFEHEIKINNEKNTFNNVLNIILILCFKFMII